MRAGSFEKASWIAGVLLVGGYACAELWIARDGEAALHKFALVRELTATVQRRDDGASQLASDGAGGHVLRFGPPDTTDWAESRIAAHGAALPGALPRAVLRIEALNLEAPVYDGATEWNLNRGAARIEGTASFAEQGNVGLAAHRDGYFRRLRDIREGDLIEVLTIDRRLQYRVKEIRIVSPRAIEVLAPTDEPTLTLVTCYPFRQVGPSPRRFIVRAVRRTDPLSGARAASE